MPDLTNPFYAVLTRGLADAVDAAGYGSYVCNTDGQHERERKFFQDVMDRGVDGIVFASGETASEIQFGPADYSTPIICIGDHLDHPLCDAVTPDDENGSREAAACWTRVEKAASRSFWLRSPVTTNWAEARVTSPFWMMALVIFTLMAQR